MGSSSYIRETERTQRLALCLAAGLLALACVVPIVAPEGREVISYWTAMALFVFAAGAIGYSRISLNTKKRLLNLSREDDHT